jgi:hypothetical protein
MIRQGSNNYRDNRDKIIDYFMNIKQGKIGRTKILLAHLHFTSD